MFPLFSGPAGVCRSAADVTVPVMVTALMVDSDSGTEPVLVAAEGMRLFG